VTSLRDGRSKNRVWLPVCTRDLCLSKEIWTFWKAPVNFYSLGTLGFCVARWLTWLRHNATGGFDSRWRHFHWQSFRPHHVSRVDSTSNRNYYQEYSLEGKGDRCVGLTTLPASRANCLEIWEPQPPGTPKACPGLYRDCFTFIFTWGFVLGEKESGR
jgi:hypothetical protein